MADKTLTPTEIKQKKRTQSNLSQVSAGLGLAALGGTALSTRGGQRGLALAARKMKKPVPQALRATPKPKGLDRTITPLLATSAGVGALGSLNFAQYTRAEANKGTKMKKNYSPSPFEDGFYGTTTEINKADEKQKRAVDVATGAAAAGTAHQGYKASKATKDLAHINRLAGGSAGITHLPNKLVGRTGLLAAGTGAGLYAGNKLRPKKKAQGGWSPYVEKSHSESAFGIVHD